MNPLNQILAVIAGLLILAGTLLGYSKLKVDGFVALIFGLAGLLLVAYGIGGIDLVNALRHG